VLKQGTSGDEKMVKDLKNFIRTTLGPIAIPSDVIFVPEVPKTKEGKPARTVIKAKALGQPLGDQSSVANPTAIEKIPLITK
jgi:acetyl-CoA synthetase